MPEAESWFGAPTTPDTACQTQSGWLQLYQSVTVNPNGHNVFHFHNPDHAVQDLHEVDPQGRFGGSVPNSDPIAVNSEYGQVSETLEDAHHEANGEIVGIQHQCDPVPSTTRPEQARKSARKRDRDRNWTEEETGVLVECKRLAFHDKASPFRKQKSSATNWEAISKELRTNPDTRASEKTGDQCRLRWDTLVKSHRIIKARCMETEKEYAELTEEEISDLKLATTLNKEWYEAIDTISRKARSQKRDNPSPSVGDFVNLEGRIENGLLPVSSRITPTDPGAHPLLAEGAPPRSPPAQVMSTGSPEAGKSSPKQIAIPRYSSLDGHLRSTLLDLISGRQFLRNRWFCEDFPDYESLSHSCRCLSIVQNRSCSEIYNDLSMLVKMELVHISGSHGDLRLDRSRFRVFDKFVKKVILNNPVYDTHKHFKFSDAIKFIAADEISIPQRIRVLKLDRCPRLERVDLRGLRKLRSLYIYRCEDLVEVTGWKFLRELGWLEIFCCRSYRDYPDFRNLPSLREFRFDRAHVSGCPPRHDLDISQCARLRRLEIFHDDQLEESGDLSSLKCLEILSFDSCGALSSITGFSELHSLTCLSLLFCHALRSLPDMGQMKELVYINVSWTDVEEIRGIEKLVSLKTLDCSFSELKHLPEASS